MSWDPILDASSRSGAGPCGLAYPSGPDQFRVEELPLYPASGEGEHLYLEIEKRGIDTPELVRRVAAVLGISDREIGWAGLKDRAAVARQRLSVPRVAGEAALARLAEGEDFEILSAMPHGNKLRPGHLAGNRFTLLLPGDPAAAAWEAGLAEIEALGLPNYFGFQRFGTRCDNHLRGRGMLSRGGRGKGRSARFLLSAYQSELFNRVLAARIDALGTLIAGDLAWIHAKGAVFAVDDPEAEQPRADALEISPSGPLPGGRMSAPAGEVLASESAALAAGGWREEWGRHLTGGRRPLRVPVAELRGEVDPRGGLRLRFVLPPGSYASVLLAELGVFPAAAGIRRG